MIKRTVEISQEPAYLSLRRRQLVIRRPQQTEAQARTVPIEDLGVLCLAHRQITITHPTLAALAEANVAVIVCGDNHLPAGSLLPVSGHLEQVSRLRSQINATAARNKRAWQTIVRAKIAAQHRLAALYDPDAARRLDVMVGEVKSGDTSNAEGHAGRAYWSILRKALPPDHTAFRRRPDGTCEINGMLNYGYSALRAAVARALVSAGLHPALGVYHHRRSNPFCLADDLVEPLRPMVDARVWDLVNGGNVGVDLDSKAHLLRLLTATVTCGSQSGPLLVALHRYASSLATHLEDHTEALSCPTYDPSDTRDDDVLDSRAS